MILSDDTLVLFSQNPLFGRYKVGKLVGRIDGYVCRLGSADSDDQYCTRLYDT